jgi:anti-sigma B factor antagonist
MRFGRVCILSTVMNANELQIAVTQGDDATIVSLSGRVSVDSSPMLRHQLLSVLNSKSTTAMVVVDLSKAPYVDLSGIATLIEALKNARNHNVGLRLTGLQGRLKNLFEVSGVLSLFEGSSHTTGSSTSKAF